MKARFGEVHQLFAPSPKGWYRRISPIAVRPGEGLLSDHIAGAQPWRRELVFCPNASFATALPNRWSGWTADLHQAGPERATSRRKLPSARP